MTGSISDTGVAVGDCAGTVVGTGGDESMITGGSVGTAVGVTVTTGSCDATVAVEAGVGDG